MSKPKLVGEMAARASVPFDDSYKELIEGAGVLDRAKKLVDGRDKQDHYGTPEEFFTRLSMAWTAQLLPKLKDGEEVTPMNAALMMNAHKGLRLVTDPMHDDSEVDLVGYGYIFGRLKRFLLGKS